jgi:hypothetical protein
VINEINIIPAELVRHLSPLTIRKMINSIPISGILHKFGDTFIYFQTGIKIGPEKSVSHFKRGDIAFSAQSSLFCIFLKDCTTAQKFNLVGRLILSNLDVFSSIRIGDQMTVRKPLKI